MKRRFNPFILVGALMILLLVCITFVLPILSSLRTSKLDISKSTALGHPQTDPLSIKRDSCCGSRLLSHQILQIKDDFILVYEYHNSASAVIEPHFQFQAFEIETSNHTFRPVVDWLLLAKIYWRRQLQHIFGNPFEISVLRTEGLKSPKINCTSSSADELQLFRLSNSPLEAFWHYSCDSKEWPKLYGQTRLLSHAGFVWPSTYQINGKHLIVDQAVPLAFFLNDIKQRYCLSVTVEVISHAQKTINLLEILYVNPFQLSNSWLSKSSDSYTGFLRNEADIVNDYPSFKNELRVPFANCATFALVSPELEMH